MTTTHRRATRRACWLGMGLEHAPPRHAPRLLARDGLRARAASPPVVHVHAHVHVHGVQGVQVHDVHVHVHVARACAMASAVSGVAWASDRSTWGGGGVISDWW